MFYISIYRTARVYGGPEEGGWHYTACEKVDDVKTVFKNKGAAEAELARLQPELDSQDETLHSEIFEGEYGPDEPGYPYNQSDYC